MAKSDLTDYEQFTVEFNDLEMLMAQDEDSDLHNFKGSKYLGKNTLYNTLYENNGITGATHRSYQQIEDIIDDYDDYRL